MALTGLTQLSTVKEREFGPLESFRGNLTALTWRALMIMLSVNGIDVKADVEPDNSAVAPVYVVHARCMSKE